MSYTFAIKLPAPGLVDIARQAEEYGLEARITPDPDGGDSVILSVPYTHEWRDEAAELEEIAENAWESYGD